MAIHVHVDGEFQAKVETPQEVKGFGNVAVLKSEQREDGDYNLYLVTVPE